MTGWRLTAALLTALAASPATAQTFDMQAEIARRSLGVQLDDGYVYNQPQGGTTGVLIDTQRADLNRYLEYQREMIDELLSRSRTDPTFRPTFDDMQPWVAPGSLQPPATPRLTVGAERIGLYNDYEVSLSMTLLGVSHGTDIYYQMDISPTEIRTLDATGTSATLYLSVAGKVQAYTLQRGTLYRIHADMSGQLIVDKMS